MQHPFITIAGHQIRLWQEPDGSKLYCVSDVGDMLKLKDSSGTFRQSAGEKIYRDTLDGPGRRVPRRVIPVDALMVAIFSRPRKGITPEQAEARKAARDWVIDQLDTL